MIIRAHRSTTLGDISTREVNGVYWDETDYRPLVQERIEASLRRDDIAVQQRWWFYDDNELRSAVIWPVEEDLLLHSLRPRVQFKADSAQAEVSADDFSGWVSIENLEGRAVTLVATRSDEDQLLLHPPIPDVRPGAEARQAAIVAIARARDGLEDALKADELLGIEKGVVEELALPAMNEIVDWLADPGAAGDMLSSDEQSRIAASWLSLERARRILERAPRAAEAVNNISDAILTLGSLWGQLGAPLP